MFIYVKNTSGRRKVSKKILEANRAHNEYIRDIIYKHGSVSKVDKTFNLDTPIYYRETNLPPVSNSIPGGGYKKSIDDYKWKRGKEESTQAIVEIEKKKRRIAPAYNKGANQYISDGADIKTLGRKI